MLAAVGHDAVSIQVIAIILYRNAVNINRVAMLQMDGPKRAVPNIYILQRDRAAIVEEAGADPQFWRLRYSPPGAELLRTEPPNRSFARNPERIGIRRFKQNPASRTRLTSLPDNRHD